MTRRIVLIAAALATLFAVPAYAAADADGDGKAASAPAPERSERSPRKEVPASDRGRNDLTSCKRDADGMRGPERSRFMTRCLRERK